MLSYHNLKLSGHPQWQYAILKLKWTKVKSIKYRSGTVIRTHSSTSFICLILPEITWKNDLKKWPLELDFLPPILLHSQQKFIDICTFSLQACGFTMFLVNYSTLMNFMAILALIAHQFIITNTEKIHTDPILSSMTFMLRFEFFTFNTK